MSEVYCPVCDEPMEPLTPKADGSPRWCCDYHGVFSDPTGTGVNFGPGQERTMVDSGLSYCVTHHGVRDVDQDECDFGRFRDGDDAPCDMRPLLYETE